MEFLAELSEMTSHRVQKKLMFGCFIAFTGQENILLSVSNINSKDKMTLKTVIIINKTKKRFIE